MSWWRHLLLKKELEPSAQSWILWINLLYFMTTIVRALWLAAKRALYFCYDRALLAWCPRIYSPCYGQFTAVNKIPADQCHMTVSHVQVYNSLRYACFFFKLSAGNLVLMYWPQNNLFLSGMKWPHSRLISSMYSILLKSCCERSCNGLLR